MNQLVKKNDASFALPAVINKGTVVKAGAVLIGLSVFAPVAYIALQATLSIFAIGVIGLLIAGSSYAIPLLGQKLENLVLGLRKQEARKNPIEQMQNRYIARSGDLRIFEGALKAIVGQIRNLERMIEDRKKADPTHDLSSMTKSLEAMKKFYNKHLEKLIAAQKALEEFKTAIERKAFEHKFAQAGQAALQSLSAAEGGDATQELLTDEAFKEVESQFDAVFGEMEMKVVIDQAKQFGYLETQEAEVIEIETVKKQSEGR